jgi:hypothetical protein
VFAVEVAENLRYSRIKVEFTARGHAVKYIRQIIPLPSGILRLEYRSGIDSSAAYPAHHFAPTLERDPVVLARTIEAWCVSGWGRTGLARTWVMVP